MLCRCSSQAVKICLNIFDESPLDRFPECSCHGVQLNSVHIISPPSPSRQCLSAHKQMQIWSWVRSGMCLIIFLLTFVRPFAPLNSVFRFYQLLSSFFFFWRVRLKPKTTPHPTNRPPVKASSHPAERLSLSPKGSQSSQEIKPSCPLHFHPATRA